MEPILKHIMKYLPEQASSYAERVDNALRLVHADMLLILIFWGLFFVYCLIRFRRREGVAAYSSKRIRFMFIPIGVIFVAEMYLVFFVQMPAWSYIMGKPPDEKGSFVAACVAEQFAWNFHTPGPDGKFGKRDIRFMETATNPLGLDPEDLSGRDDIVTINRLHVPTGKPTILYLSSKDVVHSLSIPAFRVKRDVVPGMRNFVWFEPTREGSFEIGCAQLCGNNHFRMKGEVTAVRPEVLEVWTKERLREKAEEE